jgi:hypothetical protein
MSKAKQTAQNVKVGGNLTQESSQKNTNQEVSDAEVHGNLGQQIDQKGNRLQFGNHRAYGRIGVIVLGIVAAIFIILQAFH